MCMRPKIKSTSTLLLLDLSPQDENESLTSEETSPNAKINVEWGVSYIGGDPCGSIYNQDPFDEKPSKPGFPDDMKARIEALAREKRKQSEEKMK